MRDTMKIINLDYLTYNMHSNDVGLRKISKKKKKMGVYKPTSSDFAIKLRFYK